MPSPKNFKEVQRLTGRIAALNRFISRSTDKSLPFYQILKGNKGFLWDEKCEDAFGQLKAYLTTPPVLSKLEVDEKLYLYVLVSNHEVSGVLVREDRGGEQKPIYYINGSSSKQGSSVGIKLESPTSEILEQSFRLLFNASNNETEYEALIAGFRLIQGVGAEEVVAYCDSQLVLNQFNGDYEAKDLRMEAYLEVVKGLSKDFKKFELIRIPRGENTTADALAALASTIDPELKRIIPVECISERSIKVYKEAFVVTRSRVAVYDRSEPEMELPPVKRRKSKKSNISKESSSKEPVILTENGLPETIVVTVPLIEDDHPEQDLEPNEHPEPEP
ncbi:Ribonuclease H domain [Arabidopsis thaliana x Arabidopsis arenosa]|nr:Ribonuclease H domain [Arabidopsis thaliana x Arabidopsis arenosa]